MRLFVLVEGHTEEQFVKSILAPHLWARAVWTHTMVVETSRDARGRKQRGGGHWKHWRSDLQRVMGQNPGADVSFTTMFDLYGLPNDFPGLSQYGSDPDTNRRADNLQEAMAAAIDDHRLIPYVQRHEFEALVLAGLDALEKLLDGKQDLAGIVSLRTLLSQAAPEDINDGKESAPRSGSRPRFQATARPSMGPWSSRQPVSRPCATFAPASTPGYRSSKVWGHDHPE